MVRRATIGVLVTLAGCGALDVSDPTAIEQADVDNAGGADLLRRGAEQSFAIAFGEGVRESSLFSDEFVTYDEDLSKLDQRDAVVWGVYSARIGGTAYTAWQEARRAATLALPTLRAYGADANRDAYLGEMHALRGLAVVMLAETYCPGFPLHDVVNLQPVYGGPLTTDAALARAATDFDSALTLTADSARFLNLAKIGKARTQLALGNVADAAATVAAVPTSFSWITSFSRSADPAQYNMLGFNNQDSYPMLSVSDGEGGNGLNYVSAHDPRIPVTLAFELFGATYYKPNIYPDGNASIVLATGIEARLIEAEAAVTGSGDWLGMLNTLRTNGTQTAGVWNAGTGGVAGLAPLTDPGTADARLDLVFRERAFWLFGTSHRLGDMRRLVRHYGRDAETVFPTGVFYQGNFTEYYPASTYGTATSIAFPATLEQPFSPTVTGCTAE